jgi:hypothetical protein
MAPRHRFLEPIHNVKEGLDAPSPPAGAGEDLVFIPGKDSAATRAPSVAAKLRLMARFAALAGLAAGAK